MQLAESEKYSWRNKRNTVNRMREMQLATFRLWPNLLKQGTARKSPTRDPSGLDTRTLGPEVIQFMKSRSWTGFISSFQLYFCQHVFFQTRKIYSFKRETYILSNEKKTHKSKLAQRRQISGQWVRKVHLVWGHISLFTMPIYICVKWEKGRPNILLAMVG